MVRKRGCGYAEFITDIADDHARRVRRKQHPHDAQPRLGPDRGEHIRKPGNVLFSCFLARSRQLGSPIPVIPY